MHVEDYMNETPARLLAMLTQTREDLWQAAKALADRGISRIILTGSGTSYHGALTARSFMQQWCGIPVDVYWPFLLDEMALSLSGKALAGVVGSGDMEVLYTAGQSDTLNVEITTSVDNSQARWNALFERLSLINGLPGGQLIIHDFGATPGVARIRIEQVFEEVAHA